jgi:hypothetical protein
MGEIDLRIEGLSPLLPEKDPADAISVIRDAPAVSQPGARSLLGRHQMLAEALSIRQLMSG